MPARTHDHNTDGQTYEQWLASSVDVPDGFGDWDENPYHFRRGHSLGWAMRCYTKSKAWRKLQRQKAEAIRDAAKRPTP